MNGFSVRASNAGCASVDDGLLAESQLLVHFLGPVRLTAEMGLEYVEIQSLKGVSKDFRSVHNSHLQKADTSAEHGNEFEAPAHSSAKLGAEPMAARRTSSFQHLEHHVAESKQSPWQKQRRVAANIANADEQGQHDNMAITGTSSTAELLQHVNKTRYDDEFQGSPIEGEGWSGNQQRTEQEDRVHFRQSDRARPRELRMTALHARIATLLLWTLFLFHGVGSQQLADDQQYLMKFLNVVLPDPGNLGYNSSVSACQWPGLQCLGRGVRSRIRAVAISGVGLNGTIPPGTIGKLSALHSLDLSNNSLTGEIPSDMGQLSSLAKLLLPMNRFNGSLPSSIGNLIQLRVLDISSNGLVGRIPSTLRELGSLQSLNLSHNCLSSGLATFANCTTLRFLDISSNNLSGVIPSNMFKLVNLQTLNLSRNLLSGQFPVNIAKLHSLTSLDLSQNLVYGPLPSLSSLGGLHTLSLASNKLNGSIPSSVFDLPALQYVSFADNEFSGPLPSLISGQGTIIVLDCGNNSLNGSIPLGLLAQSNLSVVRLGNNALSGSIPGNLSLHLTEIDLRSNQFEGGIPSTLGDLGEIQKLDLSSNRLTGSIPETLGSLRVLMHLGLSGNSFSRGTFPQIGLMVSLMYLNISSCNIAGPIPSSIGSLKSLMQLDLSHNHLDGSIPDALANMTKLLYLDLSYNDLSGGIPSELGSLTFLNHMNLSYNNLSGPVPTTNQLETFGESSFWANPQLCGIAVNRTCPKLTAPVPTSAPAPVPNAHIPFISTSSRSSKSSAHRHVSMIVGIVVGGVVVLCLLLAKLILCRKTRTKKLPPKEVSKYLSAPMSFETDPSMWASGVRDPGAIPVIMFEKPLLNLTFADLLLATSNFHKDTQIADGGYGPIYKGILPGGFQIVVKVLFEGGPSNEYEKAAQLEALGKVKHPNLVPLLGYCLVGDERLLVYEFMNNGDLCRRLHELPEGTHNPEDWSRDTWEHAEGEIVGNDHLSWATRHRIALGTARALAFLHHGCSPQIVHRDVKASNILLDSQFEAHLCDCGLAGLVDTDKRFETPVIGGTLGYVPPEYGQMWKATTRGDVYSFGVVLLELVTGRRPTGHYFHDSCGGNLVGWARSLIREKRGNKALDPKLVNSGAATEMLETLRLGYLCTAELPAKRPTMQQIVGLLKDIQPDNT